MRFQRFLKLVRVLRALQWEFRGYGNGNYHFSHRSEIVENTGNLLRHGNKLSQV